VALAAALTFLALRGLFTAFVCLNLLALVVAPVNLLLGANSVYLSAPPGGTASPFFFAPWPWYLLFLEFLGLLMFFLAYLPFRRPPSLREASAGTYVLHSEAVRYGTVRFADADEAFRELEEVAGR